MSVIFHPLRVREVVPDTAEAVVVAFDVPDQLREVFSFTQGQYLTLAQRPRMHVQKRDASSARSSVALLPVFE